jgi:hypothetical protein
MGSDQKNVASWSMKMDSKSRLNMAHEVQGRNNKVGSCPKQLDVESVITFFYLGLTHSTLNCVELQESEIDNHIVLVKKKITNTHAHTNKQFENRNNWEYSG